MPTFCLLQSQIQPGLAGPTSFSHHEVSFSRRLQRQCVEYSLNLYVDERTDPGKLYQVFRLVPCVQDKKRTLPTIRNLLKAGAGEVIEVAQQPFYRIGGAGEHYPHYDRDGNISPLPNTRLPKRLLGIPYHVETASPEYQEYLDVYGFGEQWFDCQDVAGFLESRGFHDASDRGPGLGPMARSQYNFDMDAFIRGKLTHDSFLLHFDCANTRHHRVSNCMHSAGPCTRIQANSGGSRLSQRPAPTPTTLDRSPSQLIKHSLRHPRF